MSEVRVNKLSPRSGTTVTLGDSGDTISIPSGVTLSNAGTNTFVSATITGDLTVDTNTLYVDSTNNRVGIGTSSPAYPLDIHGQTGSLTRLRVQNDGTLASDSSVLQLGIAGTTAESLIYFGDSGDSNVGQLRYDHASDYLSTHTAGSERMRIDSSGNLMVGKTSLSASTDGVEARANGELNASITSGIAFSLNRNTTDGTIAVFKKDGTTFGSIGVSASDNLKVFANSTGHTGFEFGEQILPMTAGSTSDNSVQLGISSKRFSDLYLGGGLYVGGTGSANYLDDYEEGTFTPVLEFGGGTTGITYSNRNGMYVKVGELVTLQIFIELSNKGSASGNASISGLPFTIRTLSNGWSGVGAGSMTWTNFASRLYSIFTNPNRNTQELGISGVTNSSGELSGQALTSGDFNNNTYFGITVSYRTT